MIGSKHKSESNEGDDDLAHGADLQVMPYTVDKPEDWQKMADANVDAIIPDDPEALVLWLRSRGLHP